LGKLELGVFDLSSVRSGRNRERGGPSPPAACEERAVRANLVGPQ